MKAYLHKLAVTGILMTGLTVTAPAQILFDANSWEATGTPMWLPGPIVGQNGWVDFGQPVPGSNLVVTTTVLGTETIEPPDGTQMHQSLAGTGFYNTWIDLVSAYEDRDAGNDTVVTENLVYLPAAHAGSTTRHGVISSAPDDTFLGGFLVRNSDRAFQLFGGGTIGGFGGVGIPGFMPRGEWVLVDYFLDYDNNLVEAYVNGVQVIFALSLDGILRYGWPLANTPPALDYDESALFQVPPAAPATDPVVGSSLFTDGYVVAAVRSVTFEGAVILEDVPTFGDAQSPVFAFFQIRNTDGTTRPAGFFSIREVTEDEVELDRGNYSVRLHNIPDGDYRLYIKGARHLSRVVDVTVSGGTVSVPTVTLLGGDANGDDSVDVLDLDLLVQSFDTLAGDPNHIPGTDFNYDNSTDVLDLDILVRNFDQAGEGF